MDYKRETENEISVVGDLAVELDLIELYESEKTEIIDTYVGVLSIICC